LVKLVQNILNNKNIDFDYAFTSHVHCTSLVGILLKLNQIKVKYFIARESTSVFRRFTGIKLFTFKFLYNLGYSKVDLLICQTDYMKDQLTEALPWLEKNVNIKTIPNPIDLDNIRTKAIESLNIEIVEPYIVSAGRLIPEKGFDILIKAFEKLTVNYSELKLIILGEGNQQEKLEEQIQKSDLQKKVYLLGFKPNVYPYLKKAKLCVVSSRIEGFPNILLQMMSQNTKVVSTLCAGGIADMEGIYTCVVDNVDALYDSINKCLVEDTRGNRLLFDEELKNRSITEFLKTINRYVQ